LFSIPETATIQAGTTLSIPLTATDADGDAIAFLTDILPTGAVFVDNGDGTGLVEFTPDPALPGGNFFTVEAVNPNVPGSPATVKTMAITVFDFPPTAPTNLITNSVTETSVRISWGASTDNVAVVGYRIFRNYSLFAVVSGDTISYADATVTKSSKYYYQVQAYDAGGNVSPGSNVIYVETPPLPVPNNGGGGPPAKRIIL
jgi:hypothetical protein